MPRRRVRAPNNRLNSPNDVAPTLLRVRMERRDGHFMPAGLLASQFATLEPADPAETLHGLDVARDLAT